MHLNWKNALDQSVLETVSTGTLGVAVSGGGDSVALLKLLHEWSGRDLEVVTVDHGLRPESAEESMAVGDLARQLGLSHTILKWTDKRPGGNLQDAARTARRKLMADWARKIGITAIALGHTADDQAETFLMRLARGSGIDGLSAMEPIYEEDDILWLRPLLSVRREQLRTYLAEAGAEYFDDPSNDDTGFDRIKMRQALGTLGALGIDVDQINETTERLRAAKQVVYTSTRDLSLACTRVLSVGEVQIDTKRLLSGQSAIRLRILSEAIRYVSGAYYVPRAHSVAQILNEIATEDFRAATLHGVVLRQKGAETVLRREPGKTDGSVGVGEVWDGRWIVSGKKQGMVKSLGESGLNRLEAWRDTGWSREALLTTPSVWVDEELLSAPLAGFGNGWEARLSLRNPFFPEPQS